MIVPFRPPRVPVVEVLEIRPRTVADVVAMGEVVFGMVIPVVVVVEVPQEVWDVAVKEIVDAS